ncbi:MAG: insecticidal delta-endotoxin Cry8Ea1 family protein [Pseudomonadota bacterium]
MATAETSILALSADNPVILAQLDYEIDYNEAAKTVVGAALGAIPYVGVALGAMVEIFWPSSKQDVWGEIEAQVEALVDQKISALVWQQTIDTLTGLRNVLDDYIYAATHYQDDPAVISQKWNVANGLFLHDVPVFKSPGYEFLLLPLFAQFANMHLLLQRDGAKFGATWGWTPSVVDGVTREITRTIASYLDYTNLVYVTALNVRTVSAPYLPNHTQPYNYVNEFRREMQLTVLDYAIAWPYFDVVEYPDPVVVPVTREIYSQAVGTADDTGLSLPANPPTEPIRQITVWGWDRIDAVQVEYPAGGGPNGVTSTGRMGNSSGGSSNPPEGGVFDLAQTGQVVRATTLSGTILNAMWLTFENGVTTPRMGGRYPGGGETRFEYPGEILSSIKIMGVSRYYGSANCAVFGFKYKGERFPEAQADLIRLFYVSDPAGTPAAELAGRLGASPATVEAIAGWAETEGWDVLREIADAARRQRLAQASA